MSTTEQRVIRAIESAPGASAKRLEAGVAARAAGVSWLIEFDERGRFVRAWRTDLREGVRGVYVRVLREVLSSLGVPL